VNNNTGPVIKQGLSKATVIGAVMAVGGIVLFMVLYLVLGNMGVQASMRILIALCVPPIIMAVLIGGYFVLFSAQKQITPPPKDRPEQPE
jgi:hypothetical protein